MNETARKYLAAAFADVMNYEADDPLQPIEPLTYVSPEGDSCLHMAAGRGDLQGVMLLVEAGLDVNRLGDLSNTPLHYARKGGHQAVVEFLISHGARPELLNEFGDRAAP
jgi:ankyrin repeat protein